RSEAEPWVASQPRYRKPQRGEIPLVVVIFCHRRNRAHSGLRVSCESLPGNQRGSRDSPLPQGEDTVRASQKTHDPHPTLSQRERERCQCLTFSDRRIITATSRAPGWAR